MSAESEKSRIAAEFKEFCYSFGASESEELMELFKQQYDAYVLAKERYDSE